MAFTSRSERNTYSRAPGSTPSVVGPGSYGSYFNQVPPPPAWPRPAACVQCLVPSQLARGVTSPPLSMATFPMDLASLERSCSSQRAAPSSVQRFALVCRRHTLTERASWLAYRGRLATAASQSLPWARAHSTPTPTRTLHPNPQPLYPVP